MGLVDYSDSEEDEEPQPKKRRLSDLPPPLPASFRDLYSSTVRTSTQDDPALHGGRTRTTPHTAGNWPTHVYLDWCLSSAEHKLLSDVLEAVRQAGGLPSDTVSLLENQLGVQLPLHISLSRPLALKTQHKGIFVEDLQAAIEAEGVRAFDVRPLELVWHPNEHGTRSFLVLSLERPAGNELNRMLRACNALAKKLGQPTLYTGGRVRDVDSFHISIAWSLELRESSCVQSVALPQSLPAKLAERLQALRIGFSELKVRIGQDVSSIALQSARTK